LNLLLNPGNNAANIANKLKTTTRLDAILMDFEIVVNRTEEKWELVKFSRKQASFNSRK